MSLATSASASANANASGVLLLAQRSVTMTMQESVKATIAQGETEVLHQMGAWILGTLDITHFVPQSQRLNVNPVDLLPITVIKKIERLRRVIQALIYS